jgi:ornithine decarboxylase
MVHTVKETLDPVTGAVAARSYFITDGVYGSFNGLIYDHGSVTSLVMRDPKQPPPTPAQEATRVPSTVFGPTCDGIDLIYKHAPMPLLRRGDWLQFPNFGAYSIAGACPFNGLNVDAPSKYYTYSHTPVADDENEGIVQSRRGATDPAILTAPEDRLCYYGVLSDLDII